jgi:fused signal recognition particle receptor
MFRFFKKKTTPDEPLPEDQATTPAPDLSISQNTSTEAPPDAADSPPVQGRRFMLSQALSGAPLGRQTGLPIASADIAQPSAAVPIVSVDAAQQPEAPAQELVQELVENQIEEQAEEQTEEQIAEQKTSWLAKLKGGLAKTGQSLGSLFVGVRVDEDLFEELETALIMADAGVEATEQLMSALRARVKRDRIEDADAVRQALKDVLADHLKILEKPFDVGHVKPLVVMITGVNGAGKTTSIGKLANALQQRGAKVLLAAGDTFRAAAREQLVEWGNRNNVSVIAQDGGDPAAVAFDSVHAGRARGMDIVMIDTAGRLPTQLHLMDELKKIRRVIAKADPTAPHEVLLVVDGNSGQNVLSHIRSFDAAVGLTGLIVTKLDGTAKGGTLAAVAAGAQGTRPVPVYWIGVGEKMEDLQPFVAADFAAALVG